MRLQTRQNEIKIPKKFFDVYGDRYNIEKARVDKEEVFGDSMFGVAIENVSHNGYFSEKILIFKNLLLQNQSIL